MPAGAVNVDMTSRAVVVIVVVLLSTSVFVCGGSSIVGDIMVVVDGS